MALGVHTRAQIRATEAARATDIAIADDIQSILPVITKEAGTLQNDNDDNDDSSSEKLVSDPLLIPNLPHSIAPRRQPATLRASMDVSIHDDLANHSKIASATTHALLKHSGEIILPSNYAPHGIVPKHGEMRVTRIQAKKISKHKAVLVVKFLAPASLKDTEIQLFCTSLEPKTRLGQGADLTLLTAIRETHPHAKTLHDIVVRTMSDADTARVLLADVAHCRSHWSCGLLIDTQRKTLASNTTKKMLSGLNSMGRAPFSTQHR